MRSGRKPGEEASMRSRTAFVAALAVIGLGFAAGSVLSQEGGGEKKENEAPAMTPEQQAEMEAWMKAGTPGEPHKRLAARAGEWEVSAKWWHSPEGPPQESKGSATFRSLFDGRYLIQEYRGDMMGMPFEGFGLEGYDNITKEYVGTWVDSMSTCMMVMKGKADEKGVVTSIGEFPHPTGGVCRMRIAVTDKDKDSFSMEMWGTEPKHPEERKVGEMTYTRKR
jgi:hypothetical protein